MANLPTIPLPKDFIGKLFSAGNCLDCGDYATLYLFSGIREGTKIPDPGILLLVHQGKACGGFRKRFGIPEEGQPGVTAACDEQGSFIGEVPEVVSRDLVEQPRGLVPTPPRHPLRRLTDE